MICARHLGRPGLVLAALAALAACVAGPTAPRAADTRLPPGIQPVAEPVLLRCGPVDRFNLDQTTTMKVAGQDLATIYSLNMAGTVERDGEDLRSTAYYIDHDGTTGKQRGPFELVVRFTDIGEPLGVEIGPLDKGTMFMPAPGSEDYRRFVEELEVAMALARFPRDPVAMGGAVYNLEALMRHSFAAGLGEVQWVASDLLAALAGWVDVAGRPHVVVEYKGSVVFETGGERARARASGYVLVDRENCAAGNGVQRFTITLLRNEDVPVMVLETVTNAGQGP